jgi:hypothetical protein
MTQTLPTPWGIAQTQEPIADGILRVTTAGHGGILLSTERAHELAVLFPEFVSFTGPRALEEDCDWAMAPLTWPEYFTDRDVYYAVRTVETNISMYGDKGWLSEEERTTKLRCWISINEKIRHSLIMTKYLLGSASGHCSAKSDFPTQNGVT